jgi:hypothetical protein
VVIDDGIWKAPATRTVARRGQPGTRSLGS